MRNYDQLVTQILAAIPTKAELAALTEDQKQTLKGAATGIDNAIFLSTPRGRELLREIRQRKPARDEYEEGCGGDAILDRNVP